MALTAFVFHTRFVMAAISNWFTLLFGPFMIIYSSNLILVSHSSKFRMPHQKLYLLTDMKIKMVSLFYSTFARVQSEH